MKIKRIIAVIFMAAFLLFAIPIVAHAADWGEGDTLDDALSQLKVGFYDTQLDWLQLPNLGVIKQRYTYFMFKNERTGAVEEHPVFCIDPTRGGAHEIVAALGPNNDSSRTATYIRGDKVGDARYKAILAAGYPHMQLGSLGLQTKEEGYYATKLALWMYIRGNDPTKLTFNGLGILSPLEYKKSNGSKFRTSFQTKHITKWTPVSVGRILKNEMYTGVLTQGKTTTPNYKVRERTQKDPGEWVRVAESHAAIIPAADFTLVAALLKKAKAFIAAPGNCRIKQRPAYDRKALRQYDVAVNNSALVRTKK